MFETLFFISTILFLLSFFGGIIMTTVNEELENSKLYANLIKFMTGSIFAIAITGLMLIVSKIF